MSLLRLIIFHLLHLDRLHLVDRTVVRQHQREIIIRVAQAKLRRAGAHPAMQAIKLLEIGCERPDAFKPEYSGYRLALVG